MVYTKKLHGLTLVCSLLAFTTCSITARTNKKSQGTVREIKNVEAFNKILKEGKPVVAKFFAPWCGPCKHMKPIVEKVAKKQTNVNFVAISSDDASVNELFRKYGVQAFPTFVLFNASGKQVDKHEGAYSEAELNDAASSLAKK